MTKAALEMGMSQLCFPIRPVGCGEEVQQRVSCTEASKLNRCIYNVTQRTGIQYQMLSGVCYGTFNVGKSMQLSEDYIQTFVAKQLKWKL